MSMASTSAFLWECARALNGWHGARADGRTHGRDISCNPSHARRAGIHSKGGPRQKFRGGATAEKANENMRPSPPGRHVFFVRALLSCSLSVPRLFAAAATPWRHHGGEEETRRNSRARRSSSQAAKQ
jgi:hypothetical protein